MLDIDLLDESQHYDNLELVKIINQLIIHAKLMSEIEHLCIGEHK